VATEIPRALPATLFWIEILLGVKGSRGQHNGWWLMIDNVTNCKKSE
jgi:hypothetical protein